MISALRSHAATTLAVLGVALPYAVAVSTTVLFRARIRSVDDYASGWLSTWDTATSWLTIGAILLGLALCWPWAKKRLTGGPLPRRRVALGIAAVLIQFVAVFFVRFLVYLSLGGIL